MNNFKELIGENAPDDYILSPGNHYNIYRDSLPALSEILKDSEIKYDAGEYSKYDGEAISAQKKFNRISEWARLSTLLTTIFSALLVISGSSVLFTGNNAGLKSVVITVSIVGGIVFSALAGSFILIIKTGKLLFKWMEKRAFAEEFRLKYFEDIVQHVYKKNDAVACTSVFEYFRRYQHEMQIAYYSQRSQQLEKRADKALITIAVLSGVVMLINGLTGILITNFPDWISLAASAIILTQALSFMINIKEHSELNISNAERYSRTRHALSNLHAKIDDIRAGIESGNTELLAKYVSAVNEIVSTEHRRWLKTMPQANSSFDELSKELEKVNTIKH